MADGKNGPNSTALPAFSSYAIRTLQSPPTLTLGLTMWFALANGMLENVTWAEAWKALACFHSFLSYAIGIRRTCPWSRVKASLLSRGHSRLAIANQFPGMCMSPAHISRAIQGACNWPVTWADTVRNSYVQICWTPQIQELNWFLLLYAIVVLRVLVSITNMAKDIWWRNLFGMTSCVMECGTGVPSPF